MNPDPRLIDSMCLRWRHDFGMDRKPGDPLSCGFTEDEREALRRSMRQVWEEVVGQGFYKYQGDLPSSERLMQIARYFAWAHRREQSYLPQTEEAIQDFYPHNWVLAAMNAAVNEAVARVQPPQSIAPPTEKKP